MFLYPATVRKDGDTFVVLFPDIPHTHTNGLTREDALAHAPDALLAGISLLMEKNLEIPAARKAGKNAVLVGLPSAVTAAKAELYTTLRRTGVRKAELARRMGIHKQQVERLLNMEHSSRIEQLEAAFGALKMRLLIDVQSAA
ncbi:MAG: type II toxin-antitoxin system HicB family antitoxin [Terriglobia bacterium]